MKSEKKWVWSKDKNTLAKLEKVRNFTISLTATGADVIVWFNDKETLHVGKFETDEEAREFLRGVIE